MFHSFECYLLPVVLQWPRGFVKESGSLLLRNQCLIVFSRSWQNRKVWQYGHSTYRSARSCYKRPAGCCFFFGVQIVCGYIPPLDWTWLQNFPFSLICSHQSKMQVLEMVSKLLQNNSGCFGARLRDNQRTALAPMR